MRNEINRFSGRTQIGSIIRKIQPQSHKMKGQWVNKWSINYAAERQREQKLGIRVRLVLKDWETSKIGARHQVIFQRKAWILEGIRENQNCLKGKGTEEEGTKKAEKKEETEKIQKEERPNVRIDTRRREMGVVKKNEKRGQLDDFKFF